MMYENGKATEEGKAAIKEMWNSGQTSSQIASVMGVSRNSIIGIVNRMRQSGHNILEKGCKRAKKVPKKTVVATNKKKEPAPRLLGEVDILGLTIRSCRFIVSEGNFRNTLYCNKDIVKGPYCADHYKLCYAPLRP